MKIETVRIGVLRKLDPRAGSRGKPIVEVSVEDVPRERLSERISEALGGEANEVRNLRGIEVHVRNACRVDVIPEGIDADPLRLVGRVVNGYLYVRARPN